MDDQSKKNNSVRNVVLSGGSSGIGQASVRHFTGRGARVAFADLQSPEEETENAFFTKADVSTSEGMDSFYSEATDKVGTPDLLICNSGFGIHEKLTEGDPDKWEKNLSNNVMGTLRMIRAFTPGMIENGHGDVVIISSVAAQSPYEYGGIYAATKAALDVISETLRLETQPQLRVSSIAPGVVNTEFFQNMNGGQTVDSIGWGALEPSEIAETIDFLVSRPKGSMVNHITLRPVAQIL